MIRLLHRWPGLIALALVTVLALSGAALSVFPAAERLAAPQAERGLSVADLATRIQSVFPGVEQIRRAPSGRITAYWFDDGVPGAAVIDPATGQARRFRRPQPGRALAHEPAPLAFSGRWRPHRNGGRSGGDAGPVALRCSARRASGGRLAALVRAPARVARRPAARGDRARGGAGADAVLRHGPLDDGLDVRSAARWRVRSELPGRGERRDRGGAGRDGTPEGDARVSNSAILASPIVATPPTPSR